MKNIITIASVLFLGSAAMAENSIETGNYVNLYSGVSSMNSQLNGTGFTSSQNGKTGTILGSDISYQFRDSSARLHLGYASMKGEFDAPAGITPAKVSMSKTQYNLMVSYAPGDANSALGFRLGIGYAYVMQGIDDTMPNALATMQSTQGFLGYMSYSHLLSENFVIASSLALYLPHQISEKSQVTGYNAHMFGAEFKATLDYFITESFSFFGGVGYSMYQTGFDGTGTRGVTSGQDTRTDLSLPLGFKIGY